MNNTLQKFNAFIDSITMYLLMVYGLSAILAVAFIFSLLHLIGITFVSLLLSTAVIMIVGYAADRLMQSTFNVPANQYSSLITCLILCFILPPNKTVHGLALIALGTLIAISSKYLIVYKYKHLFNPAAFAAIVLSISGLLPATWWIGSPHLLPFTAIFGIIILRKLRRYLFFISFLIAALAITLLVGANNHQTLHYILITFFESSPAIFLGTIMLTEPSTAPPRPYQQYIYGAIVGAIFTSQLHSGRISATPEAALIIGNIYAFIVSPKYKAKLSLIKRELIGSDTYDFVFSSPKKLAFEAGQYMEWTVFDKSPDSRGNRRSFSLSSAPIDEEVHFVTKIAEPHSTYKKALLNLKAGDQLLAGQVSGHFTLPKNKQAKTVFIAGGIGVTPFVSIAKHITATRQQCDIVMYYLLSHADEYCFKDVWQAASKFGFKTIPIQSDGQAQNNKLTLEVLKTGITDYNDRKYYISGPPKLVRAYSQLLRGQKIPRSHIKTDHFTGY